MTKKLTQSGEIQIGQYLSRPPEEVVPSMVIEEFSDCWDDDPTLLVDVYDIIAKAPTATRNAILKYFND
jgi:hypothetical protein